MKQTVSEVSLFVNLCNTVDKKNYFEFFEKEVHCVQTYSKGFKATDLLGTKHGNYTRKP